MRTYDVFLSIGLIGLALGFHPAASFDGTPSGAPVVAPKPADLGSATPLRAVPPGVVARPPAAIPRAVSPIEALRSGTQALRDGNPGQAVSALEYAAEQGMPSAMWKLGRMYADGDGVSQNKLRAFEYFRNLTKAHAYDPPGSPQARFVASAFVALGHFYLEGIPDTEVAASPMMAHEMFRYAASYFGDSEAQYQLGRLYQLGQGTPKDEVQAARWFKQAANKGQRSAQAMLGTMLFKGQGLQRQAAMGLFWLTVAREGARADEAWITETYKSAFAHASEDERALAYQYLADWLQNRR